MVRAAGIITGTFRCPLAQKDRSGIMNMFGPTPGICALYNKMLWCIAIGKMKSLLKVINCEYKAVFQGSASNIISRKAIQLLRQGLAEVVLVKILCCNQDGLAVSSVLSLREQVGSHKRGPCRTVDYDEYLGWSGRHVNGNLGFAILQLHLCSRYVLVAGTGNFICFANTFRTECQAGNGLRTTGFQYLLNTNPLGNINKFIRYGTIRKRWRSGCNVLASGNGGRNTEHHQCRRQKRGTAGHIETDILNRAGHLSGRDAGRGFYFYLLGHLCLVEATYVVEGYVNRLFDFRIDGNRLFLWIEG